MHAQEPSVSLPLHYQSVIRLFWHQENGAGCFLNTRWCSHPPGAPLLPGAGGTEGLVLVSFVLCSGARGAQGSFSCHACLRNCSNAIFFPCGVCSMQNLFHDPSSVAGSSAVPLMLSESYSCSTGHAAGTLPSHCGDSAGTAAGWAWEGILPVLSVNNVAPLLMMLLSVVQNKIAKILSMLCNWLPRSSYRNDAGVVKGYRWNF